jgi:Icc protein
LIVSQHPMTTHVLQLSDLHLFAEPDAVLREVPTRESLVEVLEAVRKTGLEFARVVVTGDVTHDERRETYQAVHTLMSEWLDRCHVLPGNHDCRALLREVFDDNAGGVGEPSEPADPDSEICFSVSVGGWRLIGLDTQVPGKVPGRIAAGMLDWLAVELQQHADEPTILFQHHPPIGVGSAWLDQVGLLDPEPYRELISRSPQVRAISCGHVHQESVGTLGRSVVLTVPSTGVQFKPLSSTIRVDSIAPGFRIFSLDDPAATADSDSTASPVWSTRVIRLPAITHPAVDE